MIGDEIHINKLKAGVSDFNKWRSTLNDCLYLNGGDFSGADLRGAQFHEIHLNGQWQIVFAFNANFRDTNLAKVSFMNASLGGANFSGANLTGANFANANLTGANLRGANLTGANLRRAVLTNADLSEATLTRAHLVEANLVNAKLSGADFTQALFLFSFKDEIGRSDISDMRYILKHGGTMIDENDLPYLKWK